LRRQQRQRREFLYKKSLEAQSKKLHERKERSKAALATGKRSKKPSTTDDTEQDAYDDEYAQAGVEDPKILITTSRDPSSKLNQFARVGFPSS
jgi:U3 small nucleolar ribonucleoprotein protein IMP4